MKILAVASTMDLKHRLGCTPAWWQLWKALHETGHEVIVTPYLGDPVDALWWRTYPNPCRTESLLYNRYHNFWKTRGKSLSERANTSAWLRLLIRHHIRPRWKRHLRMIIQSEENVDAVLFMNVPLNQVRGIPTEVIKPLGIPSIFYDGDLPSALPEYAPRRGLRFSYYDGADLSECDLFLANSEAVAPRIREMGAQTVLPFHYAVDPALFTPAETKKDIDVGYYALNSVAREDWMTKMITLPSQQLPNRRFRVAGGRFDIDLGYAQHLGDLTYSEYRGFCCRSRVNLNITSSTHAALPGTSTSRPFELAAFGCCVVSQPYIGIDRWFLPDKEIAIVQNEHDAVEKYEEFVANPQLAEQFGTRARARVLREHTYAHRARQLTAMIQKVRLGR